MMQTPSIIAIEWTQTYIYKGFGKRGCHVGEEQKDVRETSWNGIERRNQEAEECMY